MQPSPDELKVYTAGAVRDAAGVRASPGAVALRGGRVVAAGAEPDVLREVGRGGERVEVGRDWLLLPGLVNAHTHLDLTGVGYRPYGGDFIGWIKMVMEERRKPDYDPSAAVSAGATQSQAFGVLTVGDISAAEQSTKALRASTLRGVSFIEMFGHSSEESTSWNEKLKQLKPEAWQDKRVKCGLQPHAPYSANSDLYLMASMRAERYGLPMCTHVSETSEEVEFVERGTGPFRGLLESLGKWGKEAASDYGQGFSPVKWLGRGLLLIHCNYVTDSDLDDWMAYEHAYPGVAYCPRASEYFGHKNHRYRDMIEAGVNVCLGTDSIICHGTLSILDEMRLLYQRDRTDPQLLLKMATVNGMRGLQMDEADATFAPGATAGLIAIRYDDTSGADPLEQVLGAEKTPEIRVIEIPT